MELLFVAVGAAIIGTIVRYTVPGRDSHGTALIPAVAVVTASILWSAFTWAGWAFDGGWIWTITLTATVAVTLAVAFLLPRRRRAADARELDRLSRTA
ncbi:hypothetical protein [Marisediminicola sp. LYQ85]|uniref:hypothetical protein n=1 Tax=Marisediminicola sp. LYQ85 TaxID=3391062 RepID=UPI003983A49A